MKRVVLLLALALLLVPTVALADTVLDFNVIAPATGTISYDGTATGALVGQGISVNNVVGINTPLNSGVTLEIRNGILNFASGPSTGATANSWTFGGGDDSFISITGSIADMCCPGCTDTQCGDWLMYNGWFGNAFVLNSGNSFYVSIANFYDYKCYDLLAFYGLQDYAFAPLGGNFNISFNGVRVPEGGFSTTEMLSGDIVNTVPEPGTLALLGTGLLSIAGFVRRKLTS